MYQFSLDTYFLQSDQSHLRKPTQRKIESLLKKLIDLWFVITKYLQYWPSMRYWYYWRAPTHRMTWFCSMLPNLKGGPHPPSTIPTLKYINIVVSILCKYCTYFVHILHIYCTDIVHILHIEYCLWARTQVNLLSTQ